MADRLASAARSARQATKWARLLLEKLQAQRWLTDEQRAALAAHLNDIKLSCGRIARQIEGLLRVDPDAPEQWLDALVELQIELEHAMRHMAEAIPLLDEVSDQVPVEDDE